MCHNAMRRGRTPGRRCDVDFGGESLLPSVELKAGQEICQFPQELVIQVVGTHSILLISS
jgi:hypothetical protein